MMMRLKSLPAVAAGITLGLASAGAAAATDKPLLQEAFDSMTGADYTSVNGPKAYQSTLRSGVDFGGGRVISGAGTSNVTLVSFTPPQVSVGCGGIDWHLGGISWINWDQFKDILDAVIMSAEYAVVSIMLDWISEKLGSTFKSVMNALQEATKMELDSCKLGRQLVQDAFSAIAPDMVKSQSYCADRHVADGRSESLSSAGEACKNADEAKEEGAKWWEDLKQQLGFGGDKNPDGSTVKKPDDESHNQPVGAGCVGNCTWATLRASGFVPTLPPTSATASTGETSSDIELAYLRGVANGELMMSGVGFKFTGDMSQTSGAPDTWSKIYGNGATVAPTLSPENYAAIYLCGTSYILATSDNEITAGAQAAGDETGDAMFTSALTESTLRNIKAVCRQLKEVSGAVGSNQAKVITCLPSDVATDATKSNEDADTDLDLSKLSPLQGAGYDMRSAKDQCLWPAAIPLSMWADQPYVKKALLDKGLLMRNMDIMQRIFAKMIQGNTELSDDETAFIVSAPMPVYQMLSLAALFPTQGLEMVQSEAVLISVLQLQAVMDRITSDAAKFADLKRPIDRDTLIGLSQFYASVQDSFGGVNLNVDKQLDRVLALQAQVKTLQSAVMDSIYGKGLMGNLSFTRDIAALSSPTPSP